jgi:photosystem II stability/assembly factor-like uncharacterized protein
MTDAMHGWALDKNSVLKTSDGGVSWINLTPNGAIVTPATQAEFLNAQDAWFTMPNEHANTVTMFYTTTGGTTWNQSSIYEASPLGIALTFINNQIGWFEVSPGGPGAGSEPVDIFRTTNGGMTWKKIASSSDPQSGLPTGGDKSGLSFTDAQTGWATGTVASNAPWLYVTHNGGITWSTQSITGITSNAHTCYQTTPPVLMITPPVLIGTEGFLPMTVGISSSPCNVQPSTVLASTTDGGNTWSINGQMIAPFQSSNLYVVNSLFAWATDQKSGTLYQTQNGGKSWQKIASNTGLSGPMSFVNENTGFATGQADQTILKRTNDGGKTWQTISYQIHR